jgi:hypothetical protein
MSQLQRGETFIDGQTVTAARLNNLVDLATALNGLILDRTPLTASVVSLNDQVLLWDDSTNTLGRTSVQTLIASAVGVTSVALTMPSTSFNVTGSPITSTGTLNVAWDAQAANKVLAGPVSGGVATPTWRLLDVQDTTISTVVIAADNINWNLGNSFFKHLTADFNPTFTNPKEGQSITVRVLNQGGWHQDWHFTGVHWPGGVSPNPGSLDPGHSDLYHFTYIYGAYLGSYHLNYW